MHYVSTKKYQILMFEGCQYNQATAVVKLKTNVFVRVA
jgi:hypothetical protein